MVTRKIFRIELLVSSLLYKHLPQLVTGNNKNKYHFINFTHKLPFYSPPFFPRSRNSLHSIRNSRSEDEVEKQRRVDNAVHFVRNFTPPSAILTIA